MSEYWKSLPRKFCDICKCWFADNKASIEFHERGKRHQENAQKRIQEIQKRGIKDFKKQKKLEDDMAKIEKAALAAYKKDLQNNAEAVTSSIPSSLIETNNLPVVSSKPEKTFVPKAKKAPQKKIKQEPSEEPSKVCKQEPPEEPSKVWYEGITDEGYKYYWNTLDSESQWEPPAEGFVSIEDQALKDVETTVEIKIKAEETSEEENPVTVEEEKKETECSKNLPSNVGPQPKYDPYGQWITVEKSEPIQIDLQLPKPSEDIVEVVIPVARDEPRLKIKEKVISHLVGTDPTEEVTFKKRKFTGSLKRNARQRTNDDD